MYEVFVFADIKNSGVVLDQPQFFVGVLPQTLFLCKCKSFDKNFTLVWENLTFFEKPGPLGPGVGPGPGQDPG